jgi:uncharacterized membrane protein (DUF106 family)
MVFENIFLLKIPPFWAILIISLVITLVTTLVYKFTTDQSKMKKLKDDMKGHQKKIKELSKSDPQKAMAIQQQAMQQNMEYMKHSFKSTLYTFIPLILIFGWLSAHMAYYPILPNQPFNVTAYFAEGHALMANLSSIPELEIIGNATQSIIEKKTGGTGGEAVWLLKGGEGEYKLTINYNNEAYEQKIIISPEHKYAAPEQKIANSKLQKIVVGNEKIYPLGSINLFGWKPNWIWSYIILSLLLSIGIRKILKVY